jgi:hypothetical protein
MAENLPATKTSKYEAHKEGRCHSPSICSTLLSTLRELASDLKAIHIADEQWHCRVKRVVTEQPKRKRTPPYLDFFAEDQANLRKEIMLAAETGTIEFLTSS